MTGIFVAIFIAAIAVVQWVRALERRVDKRDLVGCTCCDHASLSAVRAPRAELPSARTLHRKYDQARAELKASILTRMR